LGLPGEPEEGLALLGPHGVAIDQVALVTSKLASNLCASDRLRDAADVQALIKAWALPLEFDHQLDRRVRAAYRRIWRGDVR
jgi:hypothetical protein